MLFGFWVCYWAFLVSLGRFRASVGGGGLSGDDFGFCVVLLGILATFSCFL